MASIDLQTVVALPVAGVYGVLCDLSLRPTLDPTVSEVHGVSGDAAGGATFSGRGTVTGSDSAFDGLITAIEVEQLVALAFSYPNGTRLHEEWRLRPTPSGTFVNYHAELRLPGGLFGRVLDQVFVGGGFRRQRETMLAQLKAVLDRRSI